MRRPNSGSRSYQFSLSRSRTTSPTTIVAGGFMPCAAIIPGSVASVPARVSWSGRVAQRTAIAGVSGERPRAISSRAISGNVVRPMKITSVSAWPTLLPIDRLDRVAGDEGDRRSVLAMRQRDARIGGDAERRRDARNHFERDAGIGQRFGLFAAAPEDERVAALQPDHRQAAPGALDQHGADLFLREGVVGFLLADVEPLGVRRGEVEQRVGRQVVVEDGVGLFEDAAAFDGDELGIAGSGADQVDPSRADSCAVDRLRESCARRGPAALRPVRGRSPPRPRTRPPIRARISSEPSGEATMA